MRRHLLSWSTVGVFIAAALVPSLAAAQSTASISGIVADSATGRPIPSVQVLVVGTSRGAVTDDVGRYTIRGLGAGSVVVRTQRIGYAPVSRTVTLVDGETAQANFSLAAVARVLAEVVTVGYGTDTRASVSNAVTTVTG